MSGKKGNPVAVAMRKRYGATILVHKDKRQKRKNRQSWRKEEGV